MSAQPLSFAGAGGTRLEGEQSGEGRPVVLLHGLTATRRYVVMGSRLLERSGHRVIAYDARGHGRSAPAPERDAYTYAHLADDLLGVLDELGLGRAVLAGASMGAHTALRLALEHPERVAGLVLVTPAFDPDEAPGARIPGAPVSGEETASGLRAHGDSDSPGAGAPDERFAAWDALARGLREGGVDGFMAAYDFTAVPDAWLQTVRTVVRQRLSGHEHPEAVADALEAVPRSRPFERWAQLAEIGCPTLVVASRDEADPGHPLAVAERYATAIPDTRLLVEEAGPPPRSPIAWQGGQLSKAIAGLAQRTA